MYKVIKDFFDKETGKHAVKGTMFPPADQKVSDLRISNLLDWGYIEDEVIDDEGPEEEKKPKNGNKNKKDKK